MAIVVGKVDGYITAVLPFATTERSQRSYMLRRGRILLISPFRFKPDYPLISTKIQYMTLQETIGMVRDFHDAFGITNAPQPTAHIGDDALLLRYKLMREENEEYLEAAQNGDIVEIADALGDMLYILCGTMLTHGLQDKMAAVFTEIQQSNMSKLDEKGLPIYREDGKVLKSARYVKPNIAAALES